MNNILVPKRAMLALAGLAAAGWLIVAALVLTPDQRNESVIAAEESETLGNFSAASGPDEKPAPKTESPSRP